MGDVRGGGGGGGGGERDRNIGQSTTFIRPPRQGNVCQPTAELDPTIRNPPRVLDKKYRL